MVLRRQKLVDDFEAKLEAELQRVEREIDDTLDSEFDPDNTGGVHITLRVLNDLLEDDRALTPRQINLIIERYSDEDAGWTVKLETNTEGQQELVFS